jgi:hypothetical protein
MLPRTENLNLKVLQTDKMALRRLAKLEGESMSVVVRRILRDELRRRGLSPPSVDDANQQAAEVTR